MKYLLLSLLSIIFMKTTLAQTNNLPVVPTPQIVRIGNGNFLIKKNISIIIDGNADQLKFSAEQIKETLKSYLNI